MKIKINSDEYLTLNTPDEMDWIEFIGLIEKWSKYSKILGKDNSNDINTITKLIHKSSYENIDENSSLVKPKRTYNKSKIYGQNRYGRSGKPLWEKLNREMLVNLYAAKYLDEDMFWKVVKYYDLQNYITDIKQLGNTKWCDLRRSMDIKAHEIGIVNLPDRKTTGTRVYRVNNFTNPLLEKLKNVKLRDVERHVERQQVPQVQTLKNPHENPHFINVTSEQRLAKEVIEEKIVPVMIETPKQIDATEIIKRLRSERELVIDLFTYYHTKTDQEFMDFCINNNIHNVITSKSKLNSGFGWLKMYHRILPTEINMEIK